MAGSTETESVRESEIYPLGTSRPPLGVDDLPEPEEVFKVSRLGPLQIAQFVIGPSLIALGISIGSGEWLLGPQAVGSFGFVGIGWVITVSAILQTFYNVEVSRYVVATGRFRSSDGAASRPAGSSGSHSRSSSSTSRSSSADGRQAPVRACSR